MSPCLVCLLLAVAIDDEPGFGGSPEVAEAPLVRSADDAPGLHDAGVVADEDLSGAAPAQPASTARLPAWSPPEGVSASTPALTRLESELARAHLDPARHPLLQLRVEEARLADALADAESRGLAAARDVEARWLSARALLADVEHVALFRLQRCAARAGTTVTVKRYRMTAGGPVALSTDELVAQASALDPPGCARIDLVDQALVDRVRRARHLKETLPRSTFAFHELDRRRALEQELAALTKALAAEGLERIIVEGDRGWGR
jgi:hypothetical protein